MQISSLDRPFDFWEQITSCILMFSCQVLRLSYLVFYDTGDRRSWEDGCSAKKFKQVWNQRNCQNRKGVNLKDHRHRQEYIFCRFLLLLITHTHSLLLIYFMGQFLWSFRLVDSFEEGKVGCICSILAIFSSFLSGSWENNDCWCSCRGWEWSH